MNKNIINKTRDTVEVFTGLARIGAGMAKSRARTAIGIPTLLDCDECGGTDYTMRTTDAGTACISCVEAELEDRHAMFRAAVDDLASAVTRVDKAEGHIVMLHSRHAQFRKGHDRAKAAWVTERAVLMRQRDEAQGRLAEAQGSIGEQMMETALVAGYRNAERARADKAEAERDDLVRQRDEAQQERIRETAKIQDVVKGFCDEFALVRRRMEDLKGDLAIARTEKADVSRLHDDTLTALSAAIQRAETAEAKCVKRVEQMLALKADLAVANARADKAEVERALLEAVVNALPTCAIHSGSLATSDKILVYPEGGADHHRHCDACLGGEGDAPWAPALRALWAHHTEKGGDR